MDTITSLVSHISDYLNATTWFAHIQWPFWTLLVVLAFCGYHAARFGKGKLVCLAFQNVLKLVLFYMAAAFLYVKRPEFMANFSQLPLFSATANTLSLVNPLGLLERWTTALPHVMVRLYFLLFCIAVAGSFDYPTKNPLTWAGFQAGFVGIAVAVYAGVSYLVRWVLKEYIFLFYGFVVIVILSIYAGILFGKVYFTFINKNNAEMFQKINDFFTKNKFGSQFTVAALSCVIVVGYIVVATLTGHSRMEISSFNLIAYILNGIMCFGTLYIFNHYYVK